MRRAGALLVALLGLACTAAALDKGAAFIEDTDRFPGWRGELPSHLGQAGVGDTVGFGELGKVRPRRGGGNGGGGGGGGGGAQALPACSGCGLLAVVCVRLQHAKGTARRPAQHPCHEHSTPACATPPPPPQELWRGRVEQVSWRPRAFLFHNFLTDEECEHMKGLARANLVASTVVDSKTGKQLNSSVRTSSGTFLKRGEDEVVRRIEKRISLVTMIPEGALPGAGWLG